MLDWSPVPNRLVSIINDMPREEFDQVTRKLLEQMRFNITKSDTSGRYLEYEATREEDEGRVFLIRAARGRKRVTPEELQTAVGKKSNGREMSPVYISTGGFTEDADKYADMLNISLADGEKLDLLLKNYGLAQEIEKGADRRLLEKDGDRFLPSIDELENNMRWGNDFYTSGNYKKAIEYYDAAIRLKSQYDLAWLMKGNAENALGWHEEAMESFGKALEYNPESEEAWYNMGATLYGLGRFEEELACYDKALDINPNYTKAWNNKGATLHQLGKYEEAVMCYDRVLKLEPDNISVLNNRGVALKNLGEHDESLKSFDRALRKKEDYVDAWLNKGILLHDMERYADAIMCYDYVLSRWRSPEVLCQKGVALAMLKKYRQALECFDASLELKPGWSIAIEEKDKAERAMREEAQLRHREDITARPAPPPEPEGCRNCGKPLDAEAVYCSNCGVAVSPDTEPAILPAGAPPQLEAIQEDEDIRRALDREEMLLERSRMLRSLGKPDEALSSIEEGLGIREGPELWQEKGNVLATMERWDRAVEAYDRALRARPGDMLTMSNKEIMMAKLGRHVEALAVNTRIIGTTPEDAHAWLRRAGLMREQGRFKETVECLDKLAELMPGLAEIWNAQGVALLELGRHDDCIICLDRAIQIDPDFSEAWNNKGAAMLAAGRVEKSLHYFDRAVDTDQENHGAWANKAAALYEMDRFQEAAECLEEGLTMAKDKHMLNSLGWVLLALDDMDGALEALDKAISMDRDYAEAWNNRGLAHSRKEDLTEAFDSFERALAIAPDFQDARRNRDATAKRIEHLAGKLPEKPAEKPVSEMRAEPELAEAIAEAETLEQGDMEADEFRCPHCNAVGSLDDTFCEECGQKFDRTMREDAAVEKLEDILDTEPKPARGPKPGKKHKVDVKEQLVTVPGVGYTKVEAIMDAGYDTEAKLGKASVGDLTQIPGISEGLARKIKRKYR